jgi:hypothetical protein
VIRDWWKKREQVHPAFHYPTLECGPHPVFFVSVASKGFSFSVNPLESTLMGILVSVADKRLSGE